MRLAHRIGVSLLGASAILLAASGPVCAQESPAAEGREAAASEEAPALGDVDIDALLAKPTPETPEPQRAQPAGPGDWLFQRALVLRDNERIAAFRNRAEDSLVNLLVAARRRLPSDARARIDRVLEGPWPVGAQLLLIQGLVAVLVVFLTLRLLRGRGDIAVSLEYPTELRGTFSVRITRARPGARSQNRKRIVSSGDAHRAKRKARMASRTEHHMVSRETQFRDVRAGHYTVIVDGFLQPSDGEEVLTSPLEEQQVRVRRGHTVRVDFDFRPKECPAEVRVLWDSRPVQEALVSLRGTPHSLRFARGGPARLGVSLGAHTLVVGSGDRVAEHGLQIDSFQLQSLTVDLADRDHLLFTGCPPAVAPYLNGDIPAAARELERDGQTEIAHLLLARLAQEQGHKETAASHYESAGRALEAADLRRDLSQFELSAALYERAGETERAADMYRSAGELVRAGETYQRARRFESAVDCYREAGEVSKWVEVLEGRGEPFEAAKVSIDRDDWGRAIRSLQMVTHADADYLQAAHQLIEAYSRQGHLDLAAGKLEEIVRVRGVYEVPIEACDHLAAQLEEAGDVERALDVLELVRRKDATYPSVATRIEDLRKRRSREENTSSSAPAPGGDAFSSEFRYEILEEVGRGGMGIVFKARDRRLGRVVALKRLPDNLRSHPKAVELFLREARAAAALNHPNIVTLFDAGQEGDTYYITMELLEGSPIQAIVRRRGPLSPRDVCRLGLQIASGLQYAHDQGIVHRDIKTANLFFTGARKVKIMDFGLAKMVEEVRRASTVIGGTPYYMAPEQSQGEAVDHRADLYALGVTLFEIATGKVPFFEGDVAFHHRHTEPPDPRERKEGIPEALAELILHMLAKNPDDRCGSASRVGERLQEVLRSLQD